MESTLLNELSNALSDYRNAIDRAIDPQEKEDYLRLAAVTEDVLSAMTTDDLGRVKLGVLAFSRQVSDSLSHQPPEFKPLAWKIAEVKKQVV